MEKNGLTVIAMVLIGSFVIDRLASALMFLLSLVPGWRRRYVDATFAADSVARSAAERWQKVTYFVFAIAIAAVLVRTYPEMRVLKSLGIGGKEWADDFFTLLVLVGGSDRIAAILGSPGSTRSEKPAETPIRVSGTLLLEDSESMRAPSPRNP